MTHISHPAIGQYCRLGCTNHPHASKYQGRECEIVGVHQISKGEPMVTVLFADGTWICGLFFCELEDMQGRQLSQVDFKLTAKLKQQYYSVERLQALPLGQSEASAIA